MNRETYIAHINKGGMTEEVLYFFYNLSPRLKFPMTQEEFGLLMNQWLSTALNQAEYRQYIRNNVLMLLDQFFKINKAFNLNGSILCRF